MKVGPLAFAAVALSLCLFGAAAKPDAAGTEAKKSSALYHVVSFKFKATATKEQIAEIETAFAALKGKISGIQTLNWGTNVSPEKHDKGFTHCFVLTFATDKDRDAYLVDPAHEAFVKLVGPIVEDAFVVDFWSK